MRILFKAQPLAQSVVSVRARVRVGMARDSDVKDILSLDREAAGAALHSREVLPSGLKVGRAV